MHTTAHHRLGRRLRTERHLWLAAAHVGTDGAPPPRALVWFVCHDGRLWACTHSGSSRSRLARSQPQVEVRLGTGDGCLHGRGRVTVRQRPFPLPVVGAFADKYGWDLEAPDEPEGVLDELWEIVVDRWLEPDRPA